MLEPGPLRPAEGGRLHELFVRLCEIPSPSDRERAMAGAVRGELEGLGLDVAEDESAGETGSDTGNLFARIEGPPGAPTVLLCAHLDTVPVTGPIEVVRENGTFSNRHPAILGADNKAAVAAILEAVRRFGPAGPPVGVELLFTTSEERALAGAKAFGRHRLAADFGFVFDHASPIGELVVAAPSYYALEARFHGAAAHAGVRPEAGRSAIAAAAAAIDALPLGRLDVETTANVGRIEGGTAANVVPERCRVELEARSVDHDRVTALVVEMVDAISAAAGDHECDVETTARELFRGYRMPRRARPYEVAEAALGDLGITPKPITTGGGSDANVFNALGLPCLNLADGSERNHQPDERVGVGALETLVEVVLALLARSA